jgi:hypothetical protein
MQSCESISVGAIYISTLLFWVLCHAISFIVYGYVQDRQSSVAPAVACWTPLSHHRRNHIRTSNCNKILGSMKIFASASPPSEGIGVEEP